MARYIDADAVRLAKVPYDEELSEYELGWNDAIDAIAENAPTADVVPVVRCKNCVWFDLTDPAGTLAPNAHRCKREARLWMEDDAFCAYGVRRDE